MTTPPERPPNVDPRLSTLRSAWHSLRAFLAAQLPIVLLAVAAFVVAYRWLQPTPPATLTMATGGAQGAYAEFGRRYAELLARHGITVTLRNTNGAAENLALLRDADSGVDVAFVQGGSSGKRPVDEPPNEGIVSLGTVFHEPVWLFYRDDSARRLLRGRPLENLAQLAGWRVNVGPPGSGVPPLLGRLLDAYGTGLDALQVSQLPLTPGVVELLEGRLDAVVVASAPEAAMVQMLLRTPGIRLFDFAQAEALSRRFPFMTPVVLPRGIVDLAADRPPADVHLVAPSASLLARETLHPALVQLLVQAARQVHGDAGWFQRAGDFPNPERSEWPLAAEAQRVYRSGTPWLQRYLPFWAANLIDRMWLVALSVIAVVIPLSKVLPPLVEWRIRSRIFRWYAQLRAIEDAAGQRPTAELLRELDEVDHRVEHIAVPLSYAEELYALRSHIQLVRRRVLARDAAAVPGQAGTADAAIARSLE
ncbi:TAXI family TRAP transporter solute-binding subunit [Azohydromonas sediminis]|uniref:TAXI family TRAP transporter solute-binding subunit n=1 Tax=Azohydromonas sediminis TaxID=2259674 RepID=UPI000E65C8CF|nr:TAXI family TRAP transporter solute-binding subunit [Azohydromonas sediminis]